MTICCFVFKFGNREYISHFINQMNVWGQWTGTVKTAPCRQKWINQYSLLLFLLFFLKTLKKIIMKSYQNPSGLIFKTPKQTAKRKSQSQVTSSLGHASGWPTKQWQCFNLSGSYTFPQWFRKPPNHNFILQRFATGMLISVNMGEHVSRLSCGLNLCNPPLPWS